MLKQVILAVAVALAAMAAMASGASAQETPIEVVQEDSGEPCDPCVGHVVGENRVLWMPGAIVISTCEDEYDYSLYHDGAGEVDWIALAHGSPGCHFTTCTVMDSHREINSLGELSTGGEHVVVNMCMRNPPGDEYECAVEYSIIGNGAHGGRHYSADRFCENMLWEFESDDELETQSYELLHVT